MHISTVLLNLTTLYVVRLSVVCYIPVVVEIYLAALAIP